MCLSLFPPCRSDVRPLPLSFPALPSFSCQIHPVPASFPRSVNTNNIPPRPTSRIDVEALSLHPADVSTPFHTPSASFPLTSIDQPLRRRPAFQPSSRSAIQPPGHHLSIDASIRALFLPAVLFFSFPFSFSLSLCLPLPAAAPLAVRLPV